MNIILDTIKFFTENATWWVFLNEEKIVKRTNTVLLKQQFKISKKNPILLKKAFNICQNKLYNRG